MKAFGILDSTNIGRCEHEVAVRRRRLCAQQEQPLYPCSALADRDGLGQDMLGLRSHTRFTLSRRDTEPARDLCLKDREAPT